MGAKRTVVITGLGVTSSLGMELELFWQNLLQKKSGIAKITKFDASQHFSQIAGEIKNFSPDKWMDKPEQRRLDIFSQYAVVAAENAIADAGLDFSKEDPTKTGVILGSGMGGMTEVHNQVELVKEKGARRASPYLIPKAMISASSAAVSMRYGLQGPNFVTSAACSSSAYAILSALRSIQYEETDMVITGGSEAILVSTSVAGFATARALSRRNKEPERASRPFDKERDGFVMGEGAGILVLEELERAKKRGAKIYARLCGGAGGADAYHITAPEPEGRGAVFVMEQALRNAGVNKEQISYINAHGTSTPLNDVMETKAIKKVFGDYAYKIPISSTKSMIGHLIGASSAVECIATVLSIQRNCLHGTANLEYPDPECDLDYIPGDAREVPVHYALSNSFAFGGSNACIILGKA